MTARQEAFVREYLIDLNATQAAIRAGYSPKTAASTGSENLRKPELAVAVAAAEAARAAATQLTAENILRGIAEIAFDRTAAKRDRLRGLELLGRHHALFVDRVEHSGSVELREVDLIDAEIAALSAEMARAGEEVPV